MKKTLLLSLAAMTALSLHAQQAKENSSPPLAMFYGYGGGWDLPMAERLSAKAESLGFPGLDPARLWCTGTKVSIGMDAFAVDVDNERTTNDLLGTTGDSTRTRFVWDRTTFILSWLPLRLDGFSLSIGGGVGISKYLVQFYSTQGGSIDTAADARQASLVSSWDLSAEAQTTMRIRLFKLPSAGGFALGLTAIYGWILSDPNWKLYDDIPVSDMPKPIDGFFKARVWIGLES
jgi:hypothetical protein